jgi:hypothetical protein
MSLRTASIASVIRNPVVRGIFFGRMGLSQNERTIQLLNF